MALAHWQWLLQKDALRQDACLMGLGAGSGAIYRRRLLLAYAELVQQPVELVTLSNATTESDLKQKRTIHGRNSNIIISNNNNNNNSNDPICSADPEMMQSTPSATAQPQSTSLPVIGFQDQAPVRAALRGHLLILDGLHRAERNVLPTLNNLLENREIPLEDGRLLVSAERFAQLQYRSGGGGTSSNLSSFLVPVHPNFRVVASLTLEQGHTNSTGSSRALDPPVRSRFQYRRVDPCSTDVVYEQLAQLTEETAMFDLLQTHEKGVVDSTADTVARDLAVFASAMHKASCGDAHSASDGLVRNSLHFCPVPALPALWKLQMLFPHQQPRVALERAYPYASSEPRLQKAMTAWPAAAVACETLRRVSKQVGGKTYNNNKRLLASTYELDHVQAIPEKSRHVSVCFRFNPSSDSALGTNPLNDARVTLTVTSGGEASPFNSSSSNLHNENNLVETALVSTMTTRHALTAMLQEHAAGRDLLLVSPKGEGKNAIAKHFCSLLGYQLLLFPLYNEMTANDLLFRRSSTPKRGTTKTDQQAPTIDWEESPLLIAARTGQVCVLDGIEKLPRDTLAALQGFLNDREVSLPDGTKYLRRSKDHDEEWINANRTRDATVHPSFRVVALASTPTTGRRVTPPTWLSEEVTSMFSTIALTAPTRQCLESILLPHVNSAPHELEQLLNFHERLLQSAEDCGVSPLTTRTMLRLLKNRDRSADKTLYKSLCATLLVDLLAPTQRAALESVFHSCAIVGSSSTRLGSSKRPPVSKSHQPELLDVHVDDEDILRIGDFSMQRLESRHMELVPSPYFFDIPSHIKMIQTLLREWSVGERAFLLLGNQGTGKNKICDRLCELANFEREYIQLHRDSTIGQLTISPSLEDGKIVWKDSPLVRAVTKGRALIIDEADKAPPEVVAVLKSLVEDGELLLADGRKIIRSSLCLEDGTWVSQNPSVFSLN